MNRNRVLLAFVGICVAAVVAQAQRGGPRADGPNNALDLQTAWWTDAAVTARLGLTDQQKSRIESSFQAHRQNLTSAKEALEKEEAQLSRLLDVDSIDRSAVQLQVSKVIQARSEMERVSSAMSLEIREQLTRPQWTLLQQPGGLRGGRGGAPPANPAPDSFAARYDAKKPLNLDATVTEFKFQDPHSYVIFDAVGPDGKVWSWTGELGPSTTLARQGWTATALKPGDHVLVQGSDGHDSSLHIVNIRTIRRNP